MTAWSPWERRLCFLLPFSMRMVLCAVRFSNLGGGDPNSFIHLILQVRKLFFNESTLNDKQKTLKNVEIKHLRITLKKIYYRVLNKKITNTKI